MATVDGQREQLPPITVIAHAVGVDSNAGRVGGTERQLGLLVSGYLDAGGAVTLICTRSAIGDHPLLTTRKLPLPSRPFVLAEPLFIVCATVAAAFWRRGVVQCTGAIVLSKVDVTAVHFCHTAFGDSGRTRTGSRSTAWHRLNALFAARLSTTMERWCYRRARVSAVVAPSRGLADELVRFFPRIAEIVEVIPNGIDESRFLNQSSETRAGARRELGLDPADCVAVFVGGDWERKGLAKAIEAVAAAAPWRLLVVGDGDRRGYESLAASRGVRERVIFAGARLDVERMYAAADAFVFPSDYEAAPLVTYEAAASGLPLLLPRISGATELVVDGENGWFVDTAEDIAERLAQLALDPALRARLGDGARASSFAHTQHAMVARYADLYRRLAPTDPR